MSVANDKGLKGLKGSKALWLGAAILLLGALAGVYALQSWREARRLAAEKAARIARFEKFGVSTDGVSDFHPLPPFVPNRPAIAALGGDLFRDRRLSAPACRPCMTCHQLNYGGVDGKLHGKVLTRPVQNAALAEVFLRDGSISNLADLVRHMILSPHFGGGTNLNESTSWINSDLKFAHRYKKQFPEGVNATNAVEAVVEYLKTLVAGNGAFDRHLSGQKDALTAEEVRGFKVFRTQKCVTCHDGPALGGWQVSDGRKVPALRGLSTRRRYMSDGLRSDLGAVLPFMPGGDIEAAADRRAICAFLSTL